MLEKALAREMGASPRGRAFPSAMSSRAGEAPEWPAAPKRKLRSTACDHPAPSIFRAGRHATFAALFARTKRRSAPLALYRSRKWRQSAAAAPTSGRPTVNIPPLRVSSRTSTSCAAELERNDVSGCSRWIAFRAALLNR